MNYEWMRYPDVEKIKQYVQFASTASPYDIYT